MRFPRLQQHLIAALCGVAFANLLPRFASAQEITYYNFDTPKANPGQVSYSCGNTETYPNGPVPAGVLFCFNSTNPPTDPSFTPDPGTDYSILMTTPATGQAASVWFAIPQDVVDGFNVWYQFKFTPDAGSGNTADGLAFVVQNAGGGQKDTATGCVETGNGFTALGGGGGCIGYGGIDNSVALETDTFYNSATSDNAAWDPQDLPAIGNGDNDNHIALQSCGYDSETGQPSANTPVHNSGSCLIQLTNSDNTKTSTLVSNPNASLVSSANAVPVTLADGNAHQVVIVYNGPNDSPKNYIYVYLDPGYNNGTHTPVDGSVPLFSGPFDITQYINLANDTQTLGPAYVGFTSATGAAFEQHELMAWTFTPHATVSQQQPINQPGTPTTFNFGTHSYTSNFPSGTPISQVGMGVIANTISPANFAALLGVSGGANQFNGSACQVYDDTGGNCIIYSIYCYDTTSKDVVPCPTPPSPPTDCLSNPGATDCIAVKSAYNNSIQPTSPGYLQGDPLYSPIGTISGDGTTATVTCLGECAVTANQTVAILGTSIAGFNTGITVLSVPNANTFTFASGISTSVSGNSTGGFLTSNNVQDIFNSYVPQNIDGSTGGKTKNFSDFVATAITMISSQTQLSAATLSPTPGQSDQLTATISAPNLLPAASSPADALNGTVSFSANSSPIAGCQSLAVTASQAVCSFTAPLQIGPVTIQAQYSGDPYHQGSSTTLPLNVTGAIASVSPTSINFGTFYPGGIAAKTVTITNTGNAAMTISDPLIAFVQGGQYFVAINLCPKSLAPGKSCTMIASFVAGTGTGQQMATLTIKTNASGVQPTVTLSATVINPQAKVSTNSLSFGTVKTNTGNASKSVTLTNTGTTQLSGIGAALSGPNPGDFTLGACPTSLNPSVSCVVNVTFKPSAKGSRTATLVFTDNAQNSPQKVSLSGTGN